MSVYGRRGEARGKMLYIDVVKCQGRDDCKSDSDIKAYFDNKSLFLLTNEIRFDQTQYGSNSIVEESTIESVTIGVWHQRLVFEVQKSELSLQDAIVNFNSFTELRDSSVF